MPRSTPYWTQPATELLQALGSSAAGLATDEALRRRALAGANELAPSRADRPLALLGRQFASPLVLILVFGALLSAALGDWLDAAIILVVVTGSTLLGFVQEYRGSRGRGGAARAARADLAGPARRQRVRPAGRRPRSRRRGRARGGQPRARGRRGAGRARLPGERGGAHRRVVPRREGAGHRRRGRGPRAARQLRLPRQLGAQRDRQRARRRHRPRHRDGTHRLAALASRARRRVRARHPDLRLPARARHAADGGVRPRDEPPAPSAGRRIAAVRRRAGRRPVARAAAGDRERDARQGRARHGAPRRPRATPRGDREPRLHRASCAPTRPGR